MEFGQMSFGSLFGEEYSILEPTPKKEKETKAKKASDEKGAEKKKKAAKAEKHVTLPCKVYGGSFMTTILPLEGESESITISELAKRLIAGGMDEMASNTKRIYVAEDNASVAYVTTELHAVETGNDTLLSFGENGIIFCYGEQKVTYTKDDFPDVEEDELSLAELAEKAVESFPDFKGCKMLYDVEAGTVVPQFKDALESADKVDFPLIIHVNGEVLTLTEEDVSGNTVGDVIAHVSSEFACPDVESVLYKNDNGAYFLLLKSSKSVYTSVEKKNKGAKTQKKETKYPSGAIVYLCFNGYHEQLSADKFGGKEKITKQDLIDYFKPKFAVFSSAEKIGGMSCFYDNLQNRLSVDISPGRRGAFGSSSKRRYDKSWDYEEREVYASTPDGSDPMDNIILLPSELEQIMNNPKVSCCNKEIMDKSRMPFAGCKVYANGYGAFFHKKVDGKERLVDFKYKLPKPSKTVLDGMITYFRSQMPNEAIVQLVYDHRARVYYMKLPATSVATRTAVQASFPLWHDIYKETVATFHSHDSMPAFFSSTDDEAEMDQIGVFGVIGQVDTEQPQILIRAVYEGGTKNISWDDFFAL